MLHRAFTLFELLVTITIIATVAAVVLPLMNDDSSLRVRAAVDLLISDIEMAQVMNISNPNMPVLVRFDPGNNRYWLAWASNPNRALNRPDTGEPYDITLGSGRAASAIGVSLDLITVPGNTIAFNAQGGLSDFNAQPIMHLSMGGRSRYLAIAATTGTIHELDPANVPASEPESEPTKDDPPPIK